ncbi:hypothetical protein N7492_000111 [Penicillium capsulatum]|uniref:Major facilitator superfamily (MFS) profile domain-containing protein n=1 Tax=Penicillium capsulatum TaxID=69766 RepID=A0A9W9IPT8_9EURO|nr:hypothetical protein N7492_000111 [Penicillium capsulatum]KAJ6130822.1 hypothetical protein N7512_003602 [Penicillium capsulatum]
MDSIELQQKNDPQDDVYDPIEDIDFVQEDIHSKVAKPVWILIVASVLSSTFFVALDNTIVAGVQSPIVQEFGREGKLSWLAMAFVLSSSATVLTWGKLFSIFSAKPLYLVSVTLFQVGSALCGGAPSINAFIIGRAIAGLGGAGMYIGCLNLLSVTTPDRQRPFYMALIGITWGTGIALGPVVGGAFSENVYATWRWAFYKNFCIGPNPRLIQKLSQIDYLGVFLNVGTFTALVMAIDLGGNIYDWGIGENIALWVIGGFFLTAFVLQQRFKIGTTDRERIFPADFLRTPIMWVLFILTCATSTCVVVPTYYIPLHFQLVCGDSPLAAAVGLLPFIVVMVFMGLSVGLSMMLRGFYMLWCPGGGIWTIFAGASMSMVDMHTSKSTVYIASTVIGEDAELGNSLVLAIAGAVFQNKALDDMEKIFSGEPRGKLHGVIAGSGSPLLSMASSQARDKALAAIVTAISRVYYLVVVAGALAFLVSLFMKRESVFVRAAS